MKLLNRKVFRELKILQAQTLSISILIIAGVSLLVSSWSVYRSLNRCKDDYYRTNRFADLFGYVKTAPIEMIKTLSLIPGIKTIEGRIVLEGLLSVPHADEPAVGTFVSIPSGTQPELNRLHVRLGRLPMDASTVEVLVHEAFASAHHLSLGDSITATIQGQKEVLRIVGIAISPEYIYALGAQAPLPDDRHYGVFWLPQKQIERLARMRKEMNNIVVELDHTVPQESVMVSLNRELKNYGSRDVIDRSRQISNLFVEDEINEQKTMVILDPMIFISVAAFLIHTILSRLVTIQRPQIATMKSLGYTDLEISSHYLKLVFLIVLGGSLLGVLGGKLLGQALLKTYVSYFHFPALDFSLNPISVLLGLSAGIIPGVLGGWLSVRNVYRLSPIEAMRPPTPVSYQEGWFEHFRFWQRQTAQRKLFWRNLLIKPVRMWITIFGISAAVAIIITANAWSDMIYYLLDNQFQRIQREDMSVAFLRPLPLSALRELQKMEGVVSVEGYRSIPIRLIFRNRKKELQLSGLPSDLQMLQKLDGQLRAIAIPERGLLLTRYFEKEWGIRAGDRIRIETLEGQIRELALPVTGFSDDMMGLSAVMDLNEFWRVFREQPSYNIANLKMDPLHLQETYVALKNRAYVYSVMLKKEMYRGIQRSFAGMMKLFMKVVTTFAFLIAAGVIFNSVRVGFSEHAWEMTSLRVMGFEKDSVIGMLVGETLVQMILAVFPGLALGTGLVHWTATAVHTETFGFPVVIFSATYWLSLMVITLAFIASSIWIVHKVSKMVLVEALKFRE
jgi:putative ABC transport system permease protein